jgi:hypothetical protein
MKRYHDGGALVEIVSLDGNGNFMSSEVRPFSDFEITDVLTGKTRVSQEWTDLLARRRFKGVTLLKVNRFDEVETPKIEHRPEHRREVPVQTLRPRREIRSEVLGPAMPRLMDAGWTVQAFKDNTFVCIVCDEKKSVNAMSKIEAADGSEWAQTFRNNRPVLRLKPYRTNPEYAVVCTKCANVANALKYSEGVKDVPALVERVKKAVESVKKAVKSATGRKRRMPEPDEYGNVFYGSYNGQGRFRAGIVRHEDVQAFHNRQIVGRFPESLKVNVNFKKPRVGSRLPQQLRTA